MPVTCEKCGSDDILLAGELDDGTRRVQCASCGEEWVRGTPRARDTHQMGPGPAHAQPINPRLTGTELVDGIAAAENLWIEAGGMSGPPDHRHQIEFAGSLVEFFVNPVRGSEELPMRMRGQANLIWRPLSARGTDYGQWTAIWRLGLPTLAMGGVDYAGRVIKFRRVRLQVPSFGSTVVFEVEVADVNSEAANEWCLQSERHGQRGTTGGQGRSFGWW